MQSSLIDSFSSQFLHVREFHGRGGNLVESIIYGLRNSERLHCNHIEASISTSMDELEESPGPDTKQRTVNFSGGKFNPDCSFVISLECFH